MSLETWPIIPILIVLLVMVGIYRARKEKRPTDYRGLFIMGIIWLPIGAVLYILFRSPFLLMLGAIFSIIGLSKKKEWDKPIGVSTTNKLLILGLIIILGLVFFVGLIIYYDRI